MHLLVRACLEGRCRVRPHFVSRTWSGPCRGWAQPAPARPARAPAAPGSPGPRRPGRHLTGRTSRGVWLSYFLAQVPAIALERLGAPPVWIGGLGQGLPHRLQLLPLGRQASRVLEPSAASSSRACPPPAPGRCPAVLAWLKRRRVVLPTLPRILATVAFETWTAQVGPLV